MTVAEKLEMMDLLWADLSKDAKNIPSPEWHRLELLRRDEAIKNGASTFSDWEEAKKRILESLS